MTIESVATYVLVHGGNMATETWNRIAHSQISTSDGRMSARIWDTVMPPLEAQGYRTFAPPLTDEHTSHLTGHIDQIAALITDNDLKEIILVGHSYGGMVITGVAARMPERIRHLIYIDAALPDPGQSLFDLIAAGGRDPLSFDGLEAVAPYVEKLSFNPISIKAIPKTYILCTESDFAIVTRVAMEKIAKAGKVWTTIELPTGHVPMASMPERLLPLLLEAGRPRQ